MVVEREASRGRRGGTVKCDRGFRVVAKDRNGDFSPQIGAPRVAVRATLFDSIAFHTQEGQ
jgi:hypothetical protein